MQSRVHGVELQGAAIEVSLLQAQRHQPSASLACSCPFSCTAAALALSTARPASISALTLRVPGVCVRVCVLTISLNFACRSC